MHNHRTSRSRWLCSKHLSLHLPAIVIAAYIAGCSGGSAPQTVRPDLARETLIKALTAWQAGQITEDLQAQSPAIVVQDMAWAAGQRLEEFVLQGDGKPVGANLSIEVELSLADASGKTSKQKVWYLVGTDPALTVFRDMFH